jgi:hypothetical protein
MKHFLQKTLSLGILFLVFVFFSLNTIAQQQIIVGKNYVKSNEVTLVAERGVSTTLKFDLNELYLVGVETDYGRANIMMSDNAPRMLEAGSPDLLYLPAAFIIPDQGSAELEISYGAYTDFENIEIAPSKGNLPRSIDPATVPYVKGAVYAQDAFFPGTLASLQEPFIMRDVRGQTLFVYPIQYNPVTKVLRVYSEIAVTVNYTEEAGINEFITQKRHASVDPAFNEMYNNFFINYTSLNRGYPTGEEGELLIICYDDFMSAMQPYVDWKRTIGRKTTIVPKSQAGGTGAAIKTYITNFYNNPDNNLAYVLFVGDAAQIPTLGTSSVPSDIEYGLLVGGDNYLEILPGRMSAENVTHVQTQVQRSIWYERDMATTDTWLSAAVGIAANEGSGGGHDGGEADYVHMNNVRNRLMSYGYDPVYQEYTSGCGVSPATTVAQISSRFNSGVSMGNYCNHGSQTAWTLNPFPSYSNTDVNQLQNAGKLPFLFSVACNNGEFTWTQGPCFAEAWMRATQGGQPTGAIATLMATISLSWLPPMTAQDEFVDLCLRTTHTAGGWNYGMTDNTLRTFAGTALNATQGMVARHGSSGVNDYKSWTVFGDPTLMIRTKAPQEMTVSHQPVMFFGTSEFAVNCDADGANVTLSYTNSDDEVIILGSAIVDGGMATVTLAEPVNTPMTITVCVTGRDKVTYLGEVLATPANGAYIVPTGYTVVGGEVLTYISNNAEIEVTLKNVGTEAANGPLTATLSCADPQLTIVNATAQCGAIAPDGTATVTFKVTIDNDIPDNKSFLTALEVSAAKTVWASNFALKAFAPKFKLEKVLVNGVEGGNLPQGGVVVLTAVVKNEGGADAYGAIGELEIDSEFVTVACNEAKHVGQNIPAGEEIEFQFYLITSPNMPYGHEAGFTLNVNAQYGRTFNAEFTETCSGSSAYCSNGNQNCGDGDKFTSVILYKTSAPTDLLINNQNTACAGNGYQDYTNISVALEPGEQYTIKVKCGYGTQTVGGWFDLNGNNTFDGNEKLINLSCGTSNTEYSQNFTIPTNDFVSGASRFRLVTKYNGTPVTCDNSSYGQTHDYTIVLPELYARVQNVEAVLYNEEAKITVTWDAPAEGTPTGYNVYRDGNKLNASPLSVTNFVEENITQGVYAYNVTAVYEGNKESFAEMSNVICNFEPVIEPELCESPVNLAVEIVECGTAVTWEQPENIDGELLGYNLYRDGIKLNEELILVAETQEYFEEFLENGIYAYQVSAVYEHCEESELSEEVSVEINCMGVNGYQTASFKLFPNPANSSVSFEGIELNRIELYDAQGRQLSEYAVANGKLTIDVNHYDSGFYFVIMYSETQSFVTKQLVIVK